MRPSVSACPTEVAVRYVRTDLTNDSLYARLAAHFCVHHNSLAETGLQSHILHQPLFTNWLPHWDKNLGAFLGCSAEEVGRMRGIDLIMLSHYLRFCRSCLSQGYHSVVFQHLVLYKCPHHEEALIDACPQCRHSMIPSIASVLNFPYICSNCGLRLSSLAMQRRRACDPRELDAAPSAWRHVLADAATPSIAFDKSLQFASSAASVVSRRLQRAFLFAAPGWGPQWTFQTQVVPVSRDEIDRSKVAPWVSVTLAAEGLAALLRWFSRECAGADEACALYWQLRRPARGIRLNMEVSVVGALLCKTLYCYGLIEDFVSIHERRATTLTVSSQRQAPVRYTKAIAISKDLDQRLLQLEIMGLLALLLAESRKNEPLWQLDWLRRPDPMSYAPSWVARWDGEDAKVWLRTRATESRLKRLFVRYSGRLFRHDPNPMRSSRSYCEANASDCGIQPEPLGKRSANMG